MAMFDFFKNIQARAPSGYSGSARRRLAAADRQSGSIASRSNQASVPAGTGLTTTKTIRGNTATGPAGGTATSYTTRDTRGGGGQSQSRSAGPAKASSSSGGGGYGRANQTGSKKRAGGLIRDGKHKRMMDGGMADMRRPGTMVQPGIPSGPSRPIRPVAPSKPMVQPGFPSGPSRPISPRGFGPNDGGPMPVGPRITPVDVTGMPVGGPKTRVMPTRRVMRGGGLARKGVGMALAKGGLARRAGGCAKRGVGRGKIM